MKKMIKYKWPKVKVYQWLLALAPIILLLGLAISPIEVPINSRITVEGEIEIPLVPYYSEVSGKVMSVMVNQGQSVQAGEVLVMIDDQVTQDQIKQLETNLTKAQENLNLLTKGIAGNDYQLVNNNIEIARQQMFNAQTDYLYAVTNFEKGQTYIQESKIDDVGLAQLKAKRDDAQRLFEISEMEFDSALKTGNKSQSTDKSNIVIAQAEVNLLQYQLAQARSDVAKYEIKVLDEGRVIEKPLETGAMVTPGMKVMSLSRENEKYAVFWVPQEYMDKVSYGQMMAVKTKTATSKDEVETYQGQVVYVDMKAQYTPKDAANNTNQNKLSFQVKLRLDESSDFYAAQKVTLEIER